ncbi:uncharacterized protein METZ01_LOCUS354970, partial [marine metagenome]
ERAMRIELTSPAWEAGVITIIRRPRYRLKLVPLWINFKNDKLKF